MNQELLPSLHKLEKQCEQYHEYAVTSQKNEQLRRLCVAHDYMTTQRWVAACHVTEVAGPLQQHRCICQHCSEIPAAMQ